MSKDLKYVEFPVGTDRIYQDNVYYELDRETDTLTISSEGNFRNFFKKRAPYLLNLFSLETIKTLKLLALFLSVFLFFLLILEMIFEQNDSLLSLVLISASMISLIAASNLYEIESFCNISRCKKCGRDFAYEEIKKPLIKMISTYNKYEKTVTSYMKCRYCSDEDIKIEIARRNSKSRVKNIDKSEKTCKACGKKFALVEYRYPDVHLEYYNMFRTIKHYKYMFRTIRHYKCTHCGYMEISVKEDYLATN